MYTLSSRDKDIEKRKIAREILATKHLPKWFKFLENLIEQNNESNWFVGNKISIADLAIWRLTGWLSSGIIDGVPKSILISFNKLDNLRKKVDRHPKVKEWMLKTYGKEI